MSDKIPFMKRAVQATAFTIGGGVALAFAMAGGASATTVTGQGAGVVNSGVGVANSGGNVAVGNASQNTAVCGQGAFGIVANNSCDASNQSNGTANITTGNATAVGNESSTQISQNAGAPSDPSGLVVAGQGAGVVNAGAGVANSGLNAAVGNASQNTALNGQLAIGGIANNSGGASNKSDGHASIHTGDATGIGNLSSTKIDQSAGAGDGTGLAVIGQGAGVANLGIGVANTGGNLALGNISDNLAVNLQGAFGLLANNSGDASNNSDGSASIITGNATGIGNKSDTEINQGASPDPGGLAIVGQAAPVVNAGIGLANSGLNFGLGNGSLNDAILAQVSFGLLSNNVGGPSNWSNGFAMVVTGNATGTGNLSSTDVDQSV
jgi:hypothetical protein